MDGWRHVWLGFTFLFVVIFFQQQLPRLLLPTTRSTGWQPAPATSVAHGHFPSFAIYRISCSPTGNPAPALSYRPIRRRCHASFYSGAIRDSDQSLMRSLESIYRNLSVVVGRFPQWHWKNSRVAIKFDRFEFLENDTLVDLQCCTGRRLFHLLLIFHFI